MNKPAIAGALALAIVAGLHLTERTKAQAECPAPDWYQTQNWQACASDSDCAALEQHYLIADGYRAECREE